MKMYDQSIVGYSVMGGKVEVIGEQQIEHEGATLDQYLYNIEGYTPENGKPFVSLKANIILAEVAQ